MSKESYPSGLEVLVVALGRVVAKNVCQFSGPTTIFTTSHTKWPRETFFFHHQQTLLSIIHGKGKLGNCTCHSGPSVWLLPLAVDRWILLFWALKRRKYRSLSKWTKIERFPRKMAPFSWFRGNFDKKLIWRSRHWRRIFAYVSNRHACSLAMCRTCRRNWRSIYPGAS